MDAQCEANREAAEACLARCRENLATADLASAMKYVEKSNRLFASETANELMNTIKLRMRHADAVQRVMVAPPLPLPLIPQAKGPIMPRASLII